MKIATDSAYGSGKGTRRPPPARKLRPISVQEFADLAGIELDDGAGEWTIREHSRWRLTWRRVRRQWWPIAESILTTLLYAAVVFIVTLMSLVLGRSRSVAFPLRPRRRAGTSQERKIGMTDHEIERIRAIMQDALAPLQADLAALKARVDSWPDLHFLQAAAQQQQREASEARDSRRNTEIKLDEIYGSMATSSEITRLRTEVATSIDHERALDLRISAIEMRLGIRNPLAPTE